MKSLQLKFMLFTGLTVMLFSGCTKDSDVEFPVAQKTFYSENFDSDAVVNISQLYKATGSTYTITSTSLTNITSVVATAITLVPESPIAKTYASGTVPTSPVTSGIRGILTYTDGAGTVISIHGVVTKQNGTGAATGAVSNGFSFIPTAPIPNSSNVAYTGEAYVLVLPNRESAFTAGTNVTFNTVPQTDNVLNNILLKKSGWVTYAQTGAKNWSKGIYHDNGYAICTSFTSGEPTNVAWLISPAINMDAQENEKLHFQSCTDGFVRNIDNSLELYVSSDYDGTNFTAASWQPVAFNAPTTETVKFVYVNSGLIDLSQYKGTLHFAFKVRGTSTQTGGYQLDNIRLFY